MLFNRIKDLCEDHGMSINALEKAAGLTRGSFCKWDSSVPSVDKVAAVARVLGVTVDELLREPEPAPEEQAKRDLAERLGCSVDALDKLRPEDLDLLLRAKPRAAEA